MTLRIGYASRVAIIALLLLTICVPFASIFAQEDAPEGVTIAGSLYLDTLTRQVVENYQTASSDTTEFTFSLSGNDSGFTDLCGGTADLVVSTRPITDAEILNCQNAGVSFVETLLASEGIVFVADPVIAGDTTDNFTCTYTEMLPSIVGAGAANPLNWQDVSPYAIPGELTLYGPSDTTKFTALFEELLPEGQARTDYTVYETPADVLPILQAGERNALAFMSIAEWEALTAEQKGALVPMEVGLDTTSACIAPTSENVVTGDYPFGRRLFLYANSASLAKPAMSGMLGFAFGADGVAKSATELNFSALSADNLTRSLGNVTEPRVGRTFTRPNSPVEINTAETATLTIGGSSIPAFATSGVYSAFQAQFTALTFTLNATGNDAGWLAFCNGEVGVIQVSRLATAEEAAACEANGIKTHNVLLGADAVVLVVSAANETLPTCLDYSQIRTLLVNATLDPTKGQRPTEGEATVTEPSTEPQGPTDWSAVGVEGNVPLLILAPKLGALETDILLSIIAPGENLLRRTDAPTVLTAPTGTLADVDYRLGGVPNFVDGGALTYVRWTELQASPAKDNVRLLSVGANCEAAVAPSEETILSGEYPLSMASYLVFSETALTDKTTAALYWHLYKNETLDTLEALKLIGFSREAFVNARDAVFSLIESVQTGQPTTDGEATPEATEEVTPEVTEEATEEATEEPTEEATPEVTEEATEEPTTEATAEPTVEATTETTAEPTQSGSPVPIGSLQ